MFVNASTVDYRHAFMYDVIDRFLHSRDKDWNADLFKLYGDLQAKKTRSTPKQRVPGRRKRDPRCRWPTTLASIPIRWPARRRSCSAGTES
jgi:hypothetical protein